MSLVARRPFGPRGSVLLALALAVAWAAPPHAAAPVPVPQKGGNKTVFAIALDANSKPVSDLTKEECGLREDGTDRVLVEFKPATEPLDLVLVIDTSTNIKPSMTELRAALQSFADKILDGIPGSTISVMNVAEAALTVADGKKTKEDIDKVLAKTFYGDSLRSVLLEGFMDSAKKLGKSVSPRRAIVSINVDGMSESSSYPPVKVMQEIVASGASLWAVSYQNQISMATIAKAGRQGQYRDLVLTNVPPMTGGVHLTIETASLIDDALGQIAAALSAQYRVTYTRPDGPMPKLLQMAQSRDGVRLGYPQTPPK